MIIRLQGRQSGFVTSAAVIAVLSALLYATFKRKGWL
ncbi:Mg2+ and Co2+ transporter CorA [Streptomyces griseochromogenes]|uniref:Mg2+ and Co2+ transporter CorA n=1 Tax=Streptomyces griseochromogenes TaxID=68214 RepID=A0ABS4LVJ1_9ACTN|nr:Mg2+ and Co2+ transporter CorA [Streptomyces griseochromogenes]